MASRNAPPYDAAIRWPTLTPKTHPPHSSPDVVASALTESLITMLPTNGRVRRARDRHGDAAAAVPSQHNAAADRVQHELGGVVDVELLQNVRPMSFDRRDADRQQLRHFFVAVPFRNELE